jgi:hypothetical protein
MTEAVRAETETTGGHRGSPASPLRPGLRTGEGAA